MARGNYQTRNAPAAAANNITKRWNGTSKAGKKMTQIASSGEYDRRVSGLELMMKYKEFDGYTPKQLKNAFIREHTKLHRARHLGNDSGENNGPDPDDDEIEEEVEEDVPILDDIVVRPPRGSGNPAAHPAQQALATPRRSEVATLPDSTPLEGEVPTREPKPLILPFVQTQPYYRSANSNVRKVGIQVTLTGQRVGGENDSDDDDSDGKTYAVPPSRPTEQEVEVFEGPTPGTSRVDLLVTTAQEQSDAEDNFANFPEELRAAGAEHHTDMYNMQQAINVNRDDAVQGIRWKQSFNIPFKACKEATSFIVVCSAKRSILLYIYVIEDVVEKAKSKKTKKIAILKKRIKRRFEDNLDLDLTCGPGGDCDGWNTSWSGISKRSRWF